MAEPNRLTVEELISELSKLPGWVVPAMYTKTCCGCSRAVTGVEQDDDGSVVLIG